jgi:hypothetical protein
VQTPLSRTANDECGSANYDGIVLITPIEYGTMYPDKKPVNSDKLLPIINPLSKRLESSDVIRIVMASVSLTKQPSSSMNSVCVLGAPEGYN